MRAALFAALLLGTTFYISPAAHQPPVVVVDPGHGGTDPGAVHPSGLVEKHINLAVAQDLGAYLTRHGIGVVYSRTADRPALPAERFSVVPDLRYRAALPGKFRAALLITIHTNSEPTHTVSGPIVYYDPHNPGSYPLARALAPYLWPVSHTRWSPRPVEQLVLEDAGVPAVNVEVGFLTNPIDARRLSAPWYQAQLATAMGRGILAYLSRTVQDPSYIPPADHPASTGAEMGPQVL